LESFFLISCFLTFSEQIGNYGPPDVLKLWWDHHVSRTLANGQGIGETPPREVKVKNWFKVHNKVTVDAFSTHGYCFSFCCKFREMNASPNYEAYWTYEWELKS
jgi:hypothetical protein